MEESRSSTSVHSSSRGESDVETALSFNLSQISTAAQSFDYDELIDLVGSKRSRKEAEQGTPEVNVEVVEQLEELDMSNARSSTLDNLLLDQDSSSTPVIAARESRAYIVVRPISDALLPGARRVRSFSSAVSVAQSRSDTSIDRDTFEPDYSSATISESAAVTPDQTRLSYDSEYGTSVTASQESVSDDGEKVELSTVPAGIIVSFGDEKHGIEMDLGICMALNASGGAPVISTVTLPN